MERSAPKPDYLNRPVLDDYFTAMDDLAKVVRRAVDHKPVTRGEIRKALVRYERIDRAAKGDRR